MKHKCPIPDCDTLVAANKLMCLDHWRLVPEHRAEAVHRAYRRAPRSREHFEVMRNAVTSVIDILNGTEPHQA